ncbi:hypothetical protein [Pedobacter aquatilis]|uniref:hypothetical protein n=1 Tax=Pedobacter aquatilis TaxID=351343 RepID=UPI00292E357D|nr:hypothetical protein [Pedobacter aquatilis]
MKGAANVLETSTSSVGVYIAGEAKKGGFKCYKKLAGLRADVIASIQTLAGERAS